jgi:hypothetical protein
LLRRVKELMALGTEIWPIVVLGLDDQALAFWAWNTHKTPFVARELTLRQFTKRLRRKASITYQ